jgi:hypothetical protein
LGHSQDGDFDTLIRREGRIRLLTLQQWDEWPGVERAVLPIVHNGRPPRVQTGILKGAKVTKREEATRLDEESPEGIDI